MLEISTQLSTSNRKKKAYTGELFVEGDEFALEAERLVVSDTEVSFHLTGVDYEYGAFSIEGKATSRNATSVSQGTRVWYESEDWPVIYKHYAAQDKAVIVLWRIDQTEHCCEVNGEWRQDGERWTFSGHLKPFCV